LEAKKHIMSSIYNYFSSNITHIKKYFLIAVLAVILFFGGSLNVNAQNLIDLEYNSLSFLNSNRTVLVNNGNNGFSQGSVHRYNNLITKNGVTVYAILRLVEVKNATIKIFDDDVTSGYASRFQPQIISNSLTNSYIVYQLQFYNAATNADVYLYNYCITGVDVDGSSLTSREFVEHSGYADYKVNNPSQLTVSTNSATGRTRFLGRTSNLTGLEFDNSASYIINYTNPDNIVTFVLGQTGLDDERDYSLSFGAAAGSFLNQVEVETILPVAVDDVGSLVNSNSGGVVISNVLSNDLYNGSPVSQSSISLSLLIPASNSGVSLNTSTGAVSVAAGTPSGTYSLVYQICMNENPSERCDLATVTVRVLEANLQITQTANLDTAVAGENISYTIYIANNGPTLAQEVKVTDILPSSLTFVSATTATGSWSSPYWTVGALESGASAMLNIVAKVGSSVTGMLLNSASVSSATYDPVSLNNIALKSIPVKSKSDLSLILTDSPDPAFAGDSITYTLTVSNSGPSSAQYVTVHDILPEGLVVKSTTPTKGSWNLPDWTISMLAAGSSESIKIVAEVGSNLTGLIRNSAVVSSSSTDLVSTNNSATVQTIINSSADLSVLETVQSGSYISGKEVVFVVKVKNHGPSNANSVLLNESMPSGFKNLSFSINNGATWNSFNSPYAIGTLAAADSVSVLVKGTLSDNTANGDVVSNTVSVTSSTPDKRYSNNVATASATVSFISDLQVLLSVPSAVVAGTPIVYSLRVVNNGPGLAYGVVVADTLPSTMSNANYSIDNGGSWNNWSGTFTLPLLNNNDTALFLIRGDINSGFTGSLTNKATVSSETDDNISANNQTSVSTIVSSKADLILLVSEIASPLQKNGEVVYDVSIINDGPGDAHNVVLTDVVNTLSITDLTYSVGAGWENWVNSLSIGTLKRDSVFTLQIRGVVTNAATDPISYTASVSSSDSDINAANNSQTIQTWLSREVDLSVAVSAPVSVTAGETIQYSVTVTNNSTTIDADNVLVSDILNSSIITSLEYSVNNGSTWLQWTGLLNIGYVNAGGNFSFKIRGKVLSNVSGTISHNVEVSSKASDPLLSNNTALVSSTITTAANLSIEKSIITAADDIVAGAVVEYRIRYTNNGPSDAVNCVVTDVFPLEITGTEVSGSNNSYSEWSGTHNVGTIAAGSIGAINVRGTINSNFTGSLTNQTSVASSTADPVGSNNSSQVTSAVHKNSDLLIAMTASQNPVTAGNDVFYELTVVNNGPSTVSNVLVSDTLPSELQNGQYSTNGGSGWKTWSGSYEIPSLQPMGSVNLKLMAEVKKSVANNYIITNTAKVSSSVTDLVTVNNSSTTSVTIQTESDLELKMTIDKQQANIGDQVVFTLSVLNYGLSEASDVVVSDLLPSGFTYVSDNGAGAYQPETGVWTIGTLAYVSSVSLTITANVNELGVYENTATVSSLNYDPIPANNSSTVNINPDVESVYTVIPAQNIESMTNGQRVASVTDPNGAIVSAALTSGSLPLGMSLSYSTGDIIVTDVTLLVAGTTSFYIKTKDINGGTTTQQVSITTTTTDSDIEAVYTVKKPKNIDNYLNNEVLATLNDANGEIVSVTLVSGSLPNGTELNTSTGAISIFDIVSLIPGTYNLQVNTVDELGGKTTLSISIVINPDVEAVYTSALAKNVDDYIIGDTLASAVDANGEIFSAVITSGSLPQGCKINSFSGVITVSNPTRLISGTYTVTVRTLDEEGGVSTQNVIIVFSPDVEAAYVVNQPKNVDSYKSGDTLATVSDPDALIAFAGLASGKLPAGISLDAETGTLTVQNSSLLIADSYTLSVKTVDHKDGVTIHSVALVITPDNEAIYTSHLSTNLSSYTKGQILASVTDDDGAILTAVLNSGSLPAGTSLNYLTGDIVVKDTSLLVAGTYKFHVTTTDIKGGITSQYVTISFLHTDIAIEKSCNPSLVIAGDEIVYTLKVTNYGPSVAYDVQVADTLPSLLSGIVANPSVGSWIAPVWAIGTIASGASATLTLRGKVAANATGTLSNRATVATSTSDTVLTNNSATYIAKISSMSDLAVTLTNPTETVVAGNEITYSFIVENLGKSDAQQVVVSDYLPSEITGGEFSADNGLTWKTWTGTTMLNTLSAGQNVVLIIRGVAAASLTEGSSIVNSISVESSTPDPVASNSIISATTLVDVVADLSVQMNGATTIDAGSEIAYSLTIENRGPSYAYDVIITDALPTSISNAEYSLNNGNSWKRWTGSLSFPVFETEGGLITINIRGDLASSVSGFIANQAMVSSTTTDPAFENNGSVVAALINTEADLSIMNQVVTAPVQAGQSVLYKIEVRNRGLGDASDVVITDVINPLVVSNSNYSLDGGASWQAWSGTVNVGTIAVNGSVSMLLKGVVSSGASNPLVNTASVSSSAADPDLTNNSATTSTLFNTVTDLSIYKTGPTTINAGELITYTISVVNRSSSIDALNVKIVDDIDYEKLTAVEYSTNDGTTWQPFSGTYSMGTIVARGAKTILVRAKVLSNVISNLLNSTVLTSDTPDSNPSDNISTSITLVTHLSNIAVAKALLTPATDFKAGSVVEYVVTYSNIGPSDASNFVITDNVPSQLQYVGSSCNGSAFLPWLGSLNVGTVVAGGSCTMLMRGTLASDCTGTIVNNVSVLSDCTDSVMQNNSSSASAEVVRSADLSITKTASAEPAIAGENIFYTIKVKNNGPSVADLVEVNNILPQELMFISASTISGGWSFPDWNIGTLQVGEEAEVIIVARVKASIEKGTLLISSASVSSSVPDVITSNNSSTEVTLVDAVSALRITKIGNPDPVNAGENISYLISVTNDGPSDAGNLVVTDVLSKDLSFIRASDGGILNGSEVRWNFDSLKSGEKQRLTLVTKANSDLSEGSTISNEATAKSNNTDIPVTSGAETTTVHTKSVLQVEKTASSSVAIAGGNITYSIAVTNIGPSTARSIALTDTLPANVSFISATNGGTLKNGVVTWASDRLAVGSEYVCTLVVKANSDMVEGETITNRAAASSATSEGIAVSNSEVVTIFSHSDISIVKTAFVDTVYAGTEITYSILVKNNGPSDASNVVVADELADGLSFVSASNGGVLNSKTVTWNVASMKVGDEFAVNIVVKSSSSYEKGTVIRNTATVDSDNSESPVTSIPVDIFVDTKSNLSITKTASNDSVFAGANISYSIMIANSGPSDASLMTVTDTLPEGVTFVRASQLGQFSNGVVTWNIGSLSSGSNVIYSLDVKVDSDLNSGTVISNSATLSVNSLALPIKSNRENVTVFSKSVLTLVKEAPETIMAGERLTYKLRVYNAGPSMARNVVITDVLDNALSYLSGTYVPEVTGQNVVWTFPALDAGASRDISLVDIVSVDLPEGTLIKNKATVSADNSEKIVESNETITESYRVSIDATDDEGVHVNGRDGGVAVVNVLENDLFNKAVPTSRDVTISLISSTSEQLVLDTITGEVYVNPGTQAGNYMLSYRISSNFYSAFYDEATVSVTVLASSIEINDEEGVQAEYNTAGVILNVLDNDLLNGSGISISDVVITVTTPAPVEGLYIDVYNGNVVVETRVTPAIYQLTYSVCEVLNPANCDNAVATITLSDDCDLMIPDGFSPNDDGINEYFKIRCIEKYPNASIEIYNRWGNMVYSKQKYGNTDEWGETDAWWNGFAEKSFNTGKTKLPPGTYFYVLKLNSGIDKPVVGSIFLNR
jgi:uncharacterized repeat protein (TIGR01451 family)/gliding motility-associated-like protein